MSTRIAILSILISVTGLVAAETTAITHSMLITGGKTYVIEEAAGSTGNVTWRYANPSREGWVRFLIGQCPARGC